MFDVKGKRCIVTGGSRGIGNAIVKKICMLGGKVCIADIREDEGRQSVDQIVNDLGIPKESIIFKKCDVSKRSDWISMWDEAERELGGKIEVLVNNAGGLPKNIDDDGFGPEESLSIFVHGVAIGCNLALHRMGKSHGGQGGRVVNIGSVAGLALGKMAYRVSFYSMAKSAVIALTRSFGNIPSIEKGDGIKFSVICPGLVDTPLSREAFSLEAVDGRYNSIEDFAAKEGVSVLYPNEIANAFEKILKIDKNGGCFAVLPNTSLLEYMHTENLLFNFQTMIAKLLGKLGVAVTKPYHFLLLLALLFLLALYVSNWLLEDILD